MKMTFQNLLKIGQLKVHSASAADVQKLLAAAERNLKDANLAEISSETRFDCAYKTIMQCAQIAMWTSGYRPSTNLPGHHQSLIQTLPLSLGLPVERVYVMDALRKKRNLNDYAGDPIEDAVVKQCITEAHCLLGELKSWLIKNHPQMISVRK